VAAMALLSGMLIEGWSDVKRALGLGIDAAHAAPLPRPMPARVRPVRTMPGAAMRPALRAAA
jgi:hypothetical protein